MYDHSDIRFWSDDKGYHFVGVDGETYVLVDDVLEDLDVVINDLGQVSDNLGREEK